jgi:diaminopimelate epimerase
MHLRFTKMQGAGNDFVVLSELDAPLALTPAQVRRLCDRRFGVGADQVLVVGPPRAGSTGEGLDFGYRIYNADGDEVEHCGNGARCFVRWVHGKGLSTKRELKVSTVNNTLVLALGEDGEVTVDMNRPRLAPPDVPFDTAGLVPRREGAAELWPLADVGAGLEVQVLSMGNPHAVLRVSDVDLAPVATLGPQIEGHARFARRVNAGFVQILDRRTVKLRVYERGAGETLACGTGACAAVVAGMRAGWLDRAVPVAVHTRGGLLHVGWPHDAASVTLAGPAEFVFEGEIDL